MSSAKTAGLFLLTQTQGFLRSKMKSDFTTIIPHGDVPKIGMGWRLSMNRRMGVVLNPRRGWGLVLPTGKVLFGYESKEQVLGIIKRAGDIPFDFTNSVSEQEAQALITWVFINVGRHQQWEARRGNLTLATAERDNPEDFWSLKIVGEKDAMAHSITDAAEKLLAAGVCK